MKVQEDLAQQRATALTSILSNEDSTEYWQGMSGFIMRDYCQCVTFISKEEGNVEADNCSCTAAAVPTDILVGAIDFKG